MGFTYNFSHFLKGMVSRGNINMAIWDGCKVLVSSHIISANIISK